jgi:hypothetical protein
MTTKLDKPLKREIDIDGEPYILTISPEGLLLTVKGRRKGQELKWKDLVSGDAALAVALNATLGEARASTATYQKPAKKKEKLKLSAE